KDIAAITHGFVGADLAALAKEAALVVLRRVLPDIKLKEEEPIPKELLEKLQVLQKDFFEALKVVRPSALREVLVEVPNVKWEQVGGLENIKQELIEAVDWPLKHPEAFARLGVKPPKGILMYGAPGTGKTLLAKAIATEAEANFISVKGPELLSMWVGESEKAVRKVFEKARQTAPTIIFFDEIDSIAPRRGLTHDSNVTERVVNQLLTEMDGLEEMKDVVVIAATNRPDIVDTALLRPGRFDRLILTQIPDKNARLEIFKVHSKGMPLAKDVDLDKLAEKTEGYVGADIESICREAAILALREDIKAKTISGDNFDAALKKVKPSVTKEIKEAYEKIEQHFKQEHAKQMEIEKPIYYG
ncbi:MAG: AAA family ATPase, partial [Candidatus Woesearchaeota archaeon]